MTNEPPTGLRQNLLQSYLSDPISDETFFSGCTGKELVRKLYFYPILVVDYDNMWCKVAGWSSSLVLSALAFCANSMSLSPRLAFIQTLKRNVR